MKCSLDMLLLRHFYLYVQDFSFYLFYPAPGYIILYHLESQVFLLCYLLDKC